MGLKRSGVSSHKSEFNEPEAKSVEDEIKKTFDQMELEKEKPSDLRKTFCGETQAKLKSHIKASSKMRKEYILPLNSLNESIDTLCTCLPKKNISPKVGKACLLEFMRSTLEKKTKTCKITTNYFTKDFDRVSKSKWLSNPGPRGLCNLVIVTTLERKDESNPYSIVYKQTKVDGDTDDLCSSNQFHRPYIFSYKYPQNIKFKCEYFEPGLSFM
jgi:hypothetical protein